MTWLVIEEYHLSVHVPPRLTDREVTAIRRTLGSRRFRAEMLRAIKTVAAQYPSLGRVRITLSR